jgi:hypothetical protein
MKGEAYKDRKPEQFGAQFDHQSPVRDAIVGNAGATLAVNDGQHVRICTIRPAPGRLLQYVLVGKPISPVGDLGDQSPTHRH